jgi:hypothetical protein
MLVVTFPDTGYVCFLALQPNLSLNPLHFADFINLYSYNREGLLNGGSCLSSVSQDDTENAARHACPIKVRIFDSKFDRSKSLCALDPTVTGVYEHV